MKSAGGSSMGAAAILFFVAICTVWSYNLSMDTATIRDHIDSPPSIPWQAQAGGEAVLGSLFLVPGIVLINQKQQ